MTFRKSLKSNSHENMAILFGDVYFGHKIQVPGRRWFLCGFAFEQVQGFRFKGDLELFALVSDSSDEWISLWKSHAQKAHPTHSIFTPGDANEVGTGRCPLFRERFWVVNLVAAGQLAVDEIPLVVPYGSEVSLEVTDMARAPTK